MHKISTIIIGVLILFVIVFIFIGFGFCANVTDNNRGTSGQVLINTGSAGGHQGTWKNFEDIDIIKKMNDNIDKTAFSLDEEITIRKKEDNILQSNIDNETKRATDSEDTLNNKIIAESKSREDSDKSIVNSLNDNVENLLQKINTTDLDSQGRDMTLQKNIDNESTRAQGAENTLQQNINTETINRVNADNQLQKNINVVDTNSQTRDQTLQGNINNEAIIRRNMDTQLNNRITDTNNRIDNVSNRVSRLEKTQYKVQAEFRVIDTKRFTISPYISQNFTRSCLDEAGVRVTIKLGSSYEEREIAKTNKRLENLETYLKTPEVQEAIENVKMKNIKVDTDGKSMWIKKEF